MDQSLKVGLEVNATDNATPVVRGMRDQLSRLASARSTLGVRAEHKIQREIQRTQAAYNRMARSGKLSEEELSRAFSEMKKRVAALRTEMEREASQTISNYRRMATARETLGIRSEKEIQREIQRTEASYNRLANAGVMSAQEQARAFSATTARVAQLRKELKGAQSEESSLGKHLLVAGAAAAAGAHYLMPKITNSSEYSMELMKMSNRLFHDRDTAGRQAGKAEISTAIREATLQGGGTVDSNMHGLEGLVSSNAFPFKEAAGLLPRISMTATSAGADPEEAAKLASSLHFFGIPTGKIPNALSGAVRMSQLGPVDINELARGLPGGLEQLNAIGGGGYQGLRAIFPLAEVSATGSTTPEQALINAKDLVKDILSPNVNTAARHIKINGKGINWNQSIIRMIGQGIDPIEAAHTIINKTISADSQYKSLNSQLQQTRDPVMQDRLSRQIQAVRGKMIGQFLRNEQARMAYISYDLHYDKVTGLRNQLDKEYGGTVGTLAADKDMAGIRQEPEFKTQQAGSLAMLDQSAILKPLADIEGDVAGKFTQLDEVLPNVTKGLEALGLTLGTVAAVGGTGIALSTMLGGGLSGKGLQSMKGIWQRLRGRAGTLAGDAIEGAEHLAGEAGSAVVAGGGKLGTLLKGATRWGGSALAVASGALDAWTTHTDTTLTGAQKDKQYATIATRTAGASAGGEAGAAAGTVVFPGVGTVVGGLIGSVAGYYGGDWLGSKIPDSAFTGQSKGKSNNDLSAADALGLNPQRLDVHLYVDGHELQAALDDRSTRNALRN